MKKTLLVVAAFISLSAVAQNRSALRNGEGVHSQSISFIPIGSSANAFSCAFDAKTYLWYDKDINSISFSHRCDSTYPTTGSLVYDLSTNGGHVWSNNIGPVYIDSLGIRRGRYPQGLIYNPVGNTDTANAFFHYYAPINDGTNWTGHAHGTAALGTAFSTQTYDGFYPGFQGVIPNGFQIVKNTGVVWNSDISGSSNAILISKGVWNGVDDFNYAHDSFPAFMPAGACGMGIRSYVTHSMTWSDDGITGYVAIIGSDSATATNYYLMIYKTIDGGVTWNFEARPNINGVDPLLNGTGILYTCAYECDAVVDANSNLHIVVAIGPGITGCSIGTAFGQWGIFDIYTVDGGSSWFAKLLDTPQTFRGTFGDGSTANPTIAIDSRPQASRTWDGTKVCFTWFDTDTAAHLITTNSFPDMHSRCYDIVSGLCTDTMNFTEGTPASGLCAFGNVSYYLREDSGALYIPCVVGIPSTVIATGSPMHYWYIDGAKVSAFNLACNEVPLVNPLGIAAAAAATAFTVSDNYPNPFSGKTFLDVTFGNTSSHSSSVSIEVSNLLGEIISRKTYFNLHSGKNTLTIDGSNLAKGIYIYKAIAGTKTVVKRMCVE